MRKIAWSEQARANIRSLDRDIAMRIFVALHRFVETGDGDVKKLKGESGEVEITEWGVKVTHRPAKTLTSNNNNW